MSTNNKNDPFNQMPLEFSSDVENTICPLSEALRSIRWDDQSDSSDEQLYRSEGVAHRSDSSLNSESLEVLEHGIELWKYATKHPRVIVRAPAATEEVRLKGLFKKKKVDDVLYVDKVPVNNSSSKRTRSKSKEGRSGKRRSEAEDKSNPKEDTVVTAVRVRLPQIAVTSADIKSSRKNRKKENPYLGSTPRTPVEIVQPNADGIYDFTPSAAAFKWNWNVLDVSKRPIGGMTPYSSATPFNAFGKFREDFHATPAHKSSNTLLVRQASRHKRRSDELSASCDDLPEFPDDRKVAKAVRKRNLAFTPGGRRKGREVELSYRPLYEALITEGAAEQTSYQIRDGRVVSTRDPVMRSRGRSHCTRDSSNSVSTVVTLEDGSPHEKKRLVNHSHYAASGNRTSCKGSVEWFGHRSGKMLGTGAHDYHIIVNMGNALINFSTIFCLDKPKLGVSSARRLQAVAPSAVYWIILLSAAVFLSGFVYEGIRLTLITTKTPRNKENLSFVQALNKAIVSSANALAILAGMSFGISILTCSLFTLLQGHPDTPEFFKNESKAFLWTVALIHSGVASGLLTSKWFSTGCKCAKPALEQLKLHKIGVTVGSIAPVTLGWIGVRILVNIVRPSMVDPSPWKYENSWLPRAMSLIEYFESAGYWKVILWWSVACVIILILLDFVDLTVSLTGKFYRYGSDLHFAESTKAKGIVATLARTAVATAIGTGSFWQWPLSIVTQIGDRVKIMANSELNYAGRHYV